MRVNPSDIKTDKCRESPQTQHNMFSKEVITPSPEKMPQGILHIT